MRKGLFTLLLILCFVGCQTPPKTSPTPGRLPPTETSSSTVSLPTETPLVDEANPAVHPFAVDISRPFAETQSDGSPLTLKTWEEKPYAGKVMSLPINLNEIANTHVTDGFTTEQKSFLTKNGFVVMHSQHEQFGDIQDTLISVGQPYFVTTDVAFHAMHLTFDDTLKALEREKLRPQIIAVTKATLNEVISALPAVQGTATEADAYKAIAYLSVALKLFDPQADVDASVADVVSK